MLPCDPVLVPHGGLPPEIAENEEHGPVPCSMAVIWAIDTTRWAWSGKSTE
jgi:hypothetical protein